MLNKFSIPLSLSHTSSGLKFTDCILNFQFKTAKAWILFFEVFLKIKKEKNKNKKSPEKTKELENKGPWATLLT